MSGYQQRLQGKVRLSRIRRIRNMALLALGGVTAVFILSGFAAEGASLKPLYLPLGEAVEIGLIMVLVATVLAMYFRNLEFKHAAGDSQRFLMAKESMARSTGLAIASVVFAVLLFLPMSPGVSGGLLTDPPTPVTVAGFGSGELNFTSPDGLGLSFVRRVVVVGASWSAGDVQVTVLFGGRVMGSGWVNASGRAELPLDATSRLTFGTWTVSFQNVASGSAALNLVLEEAVMPALFAFVPFLLVLNAAANVGFWVGVRPIRERTRAAAVYAGGVSTTQEQDERFYAEYAANPVQDMIPMEPPPPPPAPEVRLSNPMPSPVVAPSLPPAEPPAPASVPRTAKPKPDTPETFVAKADVLGSAGQHDSALVAYDEALRLNPSHLPGLLGRAKSLAGMGRRADALEAYRRVVTADRRNEEAQRAIASILTGERRWREALEAVDAFLRQRPNDAASLHLRGDILTNLGRRTEALTAYNGAFALDPTDENLKQKIEEVRVDVPGILSRALIASASGNYAQALGLFDEILEIDPGNVNALIGKAVAYRRSGKSREAINCLDLVLSIQPENAAALYNRGQLLETSGDLEEALETYDRLVSVSSLDDEAWAAQGDILTKMGRDDDALRAYAEALKLNPGDELIRAKVRELEEARTVQSDILDELYKVKGIGPSKAKALLDAGFNTADGFALADVDQLVAVKGITRKIAQDLLRHFRKENVQVR
ncbi:MAG TPA: tetratricopeptide repeat protein [Thermoplasmata archaeon]|nr:tetratricopeptide repeat protein [Thermoplasmata archaeon]